MSSVGADKAGYASVLFPLVALTLLRRGDAAPAALPAPLASLTPISER